MCHLTDLTDLGVHFKVYSPKVQLSVYMHLIKLFNSFMPPMTYYFILSGTTDVQTARIIFFQNNIYVTCTFASNSNARGCRFKFVLANQNEVEPFFISRSSSTVSQCNVTMNQRRAYVNFTVTDVEANGTNGTRPIVLDNRTDIDSLNSAAEYFSVTGCTIPEPESPLSAGAIAGIVIAALILAAMVVCVVVVIVVYRVKTGEWFKLREKDEDKLTVLFEKELLMGNTKPKRKPSQRKPKVGIHPCSLSLM